MSSFISAKQPVNLVNFLIAGTQKGGTTALENYMREHPQISMANPKEVHFFDNESKFISSPDYSSYHSHFKPHSADQVLGEATPIYMYWYSAPRRIWEYNPLMKFILILRNPIERAYSHWNMERARGNDTLPFSNAIQVEAERCRTALPLQHREFSYIDRGFYSDQIRRIWHFFPKDQTLIMKSEDLHNHLSDQLSLVSSFLDIDAFPHVQPRSIHSASYLENMDKCDRAKLHSIYSAEIKSIESMIHWDCSNWL